MAWLIIAVVALLLGVAAILLWGPSKRSRRPVEVEPAQAPPAKTLVTTRVLYPAPRVDGLSLRDWLIHHVHRDGVWTEVVAEFYAEAASDPEIFVYFARTDMERLQRHFLATLLVLTHAGLTVGTLEAMRERHAGLGITGPVFDRTVTALVGVLSDKGVPLRAIADLGPAVAELRAVIVAA